MSGCISDAACSRSLKLAYRYGNGHVASNILRDEKQRRKSHAFWYSCWKTPYPNERGITMQDMIFFWMSFHLIKASLLEHQVSFLLQASWDARFPGHPSVPIGVVGEALFCIRAESMTSLSPSFVYKPSFVNMTLSTVERSLTSGDFGYCLYQADSHDGYPKHNANRSWYCSPATATQFNIT